MTVPKRRVSYAQRFDRVLDHIADHLTEDLSLTTLARVAGFSPFHLHRLFQAHTHETLHAHVRRIRIERAASLMRTSRRPLTELALEVGFPALSDLSRAFKAVYGIPPSKWDRRSPLVTNASYAGVAPAPIRPRITSLPRSLFVYTRVFDPYGNQRLIEVYNATRAWLDTIGRAPHDIAFAGMSMDDPSVTPPKQCRYDLGVVFPLELGGVFDDIARYRKAKLRVAPPSPAQCTDFSTRRFPALDLATVRCEGKLDVVAQAWTSLYGHYLPSQSRLPANHPAMELFVRIPEEIGWTDFDLVACVPLA